MRQVLFPLIVLGLAALLMPPVAARAGDFAAYEVLGFSADGGIFAFEEYGVQDGSGFPYANRFYIDTATDHFVPGGAIRVRLEDDAADASAARDQARLKGEAIAPDATLAANPGYLAGANAVTELSADPFRMTVYPRPFLPTSDVPLEFRLEELPMAASTTCENIGPVAGFRLIRILAIPGGSTALLHEDTTIPASRACPQGYRIGGVVTFHPEFGPPVYAVMIAVRSMGFEGPDYRWIAVTGQL